MKTSAPDKLGSNKRIAVAMSGGVDSGVAAALLKQAGHEVFGVTLKLQECEAMSSSRSCCGVDGLVRATEVAGQLGIRHYVLSCVKDFEDLVLRPAWLEYERGRTPSPCLLCNERIKFGLLLSWAQGLGATHLATGHYARTIKGPGGVQLLRAADRTKDQSYFLAGLDANQLQSTLFPLGDFPKSKVRELASDLKLACAETPDSQDACLMQKGQSFAEMLRMRFNAPLQPGDIIDDGLVVGHHNGLHNYTIGQRHGLPVRSCSSSYVLKLNRERNTVAITHQAEELFSDHFTASGVTWIGDGHGEPGSQCEVQIRSRHKPSPCSIRILASGRVKISLEKPVKAITPGQAAVFYDQDRVLGRGWIDDAG